ncbi:MAG: response regulator [Turneriella sp.]|mgnify:CR=1 FL=1
MATILAVDDSETMRQMVKLTLMAGNHKVVLADDGEDGLSKYLSTTNFDLVITDINMPKMDGIGLIKEIRSRNNTIPILALTTESEDGMRKKGADAGANGWLVKPFKPAQFMDIVRQIL